MLDRMTEWTRSKRRLSLMISSELESCPDLRTLLQMSLLGEGSGYWFLFCHGPEGITLSVLASAIACPMHLCPSKLLLFFIGNHGGSCSCWVDLGWLFSSLFFLFSIYTTLIWSKCCIFHLPSLWWIWDDVASVCLLITTDIIFGARNILESGYAWSRILLDLVKQWIGRVMSLLVPRVARELNCSLIWPHIPST